MKIIVVTLSLVTLVFCVGAIYQIACPILQPVVYLDQTYQRMILGPTTRSKTLAVEWATHETAKHQNAEYMILQNLHWNRDLDIVECQTKFR